MKNQTSSLVEHKMRNQEWQMTATVMAISLHFVLFRSVCFVGFCFGGRELIHTNKWLQIVTVFFKAPLQLRILYS